MARPEGSPYIQASSVVTNNADVAAIESASATKPAPSSGAYVHKPYIQASKVITNHPDVRGIESRSAKAGAGVHDIRMPVDASCGHCFPPTLPCSGSMDTYTDQFSQVRVTDCYVPHCCGPNCHQPFASQGSVTTYSDMLAKHCSTHAMSCGDFACNGSMDTNSGY